jgi:hypothetical protein
MVKAEPAGNLVDKITEPQERNQGEGSGFIVYMPLLFL